MRFSILTLFPEMFFEILESSIIGNAVRSGKISADFVNIRQFANDKHQTVDDKPYGGGVGMILKIDVLHKALLSVLCKNTCREKIILLDPKGKSFNQKTALRYAKLDHLILLCGHYEGIDHRIKHYVDETVSVGDFILTGGEIPAMSILDSVTRLVTGVLKPEATKNETVPFVKLEYPQYTRPENYNGLKVPKVLLSGNHEEIQKWRTKKTKYLLSIK